MYCSNCGKELEKAQIYCSFCGTKCSDVIISNSTKIKNESITKSAEETKESVNVSAIMIQRAYIILCCVSISLTCFWSAIIRESEFEGFIGVFGFMEFALIFMSIFLLTLNKRYQYNAAKVVILFSVLTAGEVLFLFLNIENPEASIFVEIFFSILIALVYILLKREINSMLGNNTNYSKNTADSVICCSDIKHAMYRKQITSVGKNTTNGCWKYNSALGEKTFICNHCNTIIAYEEDFVNPNI